MPSFFPLIFFPSHTHTLVPLPLPLPPHTHTPVSVKVYYPCILQTKNRYCGYMYETPDQTEPVYDAKGIETVRRDTCPAVAKVI